MLLKYMFERIKRSGTRSAIARYIKYESTA